MLSLAGSARRQAIDVTKRTILRTLLEEPSPVFVAHPDNPSENGLTSGWHQVDAHTYRLDPTFDLANDAADYWLFALGHWYLFVARTSVAGEWPDPFRSKPTDLLRWMRSVEIQALIASWPDDTDWVIALATNGQT
jgi:hypothetical protein